MARGLLSEDRRDRGRERGPGAQGRGSTSSPGPGARPRPARWPTAGAAAPARSRCRTSTSRCASARRARSSSRRAPAASTSPRPTLVARKAGKTQQKFLKMKFSDLLVSSFQTGGSGSGRSRPDRPDLPELREDRVRVRPAGREGQPRRLRSARAGTSRRTSRPERPPDRTPERRRPPAREAGFPFPVRPPGLPSGARAARTVSARLGLAGVEVDRAELEDADVLAVDEERPEARGRPAGRPTRFFQSVIRPSFTRSSA